jgi:hypothetical protein
MSTLKSAFFCFISAILLTTCASEFGQKINGNGDPIKITRETSDYDVLHLSGWMDFELIEGGEGQITIEGESNLLEYIITETKGNELIIKVENNINLNTSRNKTIKITIPFKDISEISLSGSGDVSSKSVINSENFKTKLSGSGDVILSVNAEHINSSVTGSGDLTLKGRTTHLETSVTGSGNFHGYELSSKNVDAKVTGSGDVDVLVSENLKARVTGSGDIYYKGTAKNIDQKVTGSGDITSKK